MQRMAVGPHARLQFPHLPGTRFDDIAKTHSLRLGNNLINRTESLLPGIAQIDRYLYVDFSPSCVARGENHAFRGVSRNQASLFAQLDRLGTPLRAKFVKHPAGVCLHRVLADKQALGDFAVAEPGCDQAENL